jgi:hypothetical protein
MSVNISTGVLSQLLPLDSASVWCCCVGPLAAALAAVWRPTSTCAASGTLWVWASPCGTRVALCETDGHMWNHWSSHNLDNTKVYLFGVYDKSLSACIRNLHCFIFLILMPYNFYFLNPKSVLPRFGTTKRNGFSRRHSPRINDEVRLDFQKTEAGTTAELLAVPWLCWKRNLEEFFLWIQFILHLPHLRTVS